MELAYVELVAGLMIGDWKREGTQLAIFYGLPNPAGFFFARFFLNDFSLPS